MVQNPCLPSVEVIARSVARRSEMRTVGLRDLTAHYAERFRRLWRLYLAYREAGFEEHRVGVVQVLLAKSRWRAPNVPRPRERDRLPRGRVRLP